MSYLGYLRLNFAGTFQADVATVNNVPPYYNNDLFEPRFQRRMDLPDVNGLWNPRGTGSVRLTDVRITSACHADGRVVTAKSKDPIVGGRVADAGKRTTGRIVDLDPEYQLVPEFYGLRMRLLDSSGREALRGDYEPSPLKDMWMRAPLSGGRQRQDVSAAYHSVLTNLVWAGHLTSPLLRDLRAATQEGLLSIKFTTDGVEDGVEVWPDDLTFGRIVGSIGPYRSGEARQFVNARRLHTASADSSMNHAPCRVDEETRTVFVDLGNSIRATVRGGPLVDVGRLRLAVLDKAGKPTVLASLDGMEKGYYERTAAIMTAKLRPEHMQAVAGGRLAVVRTDPEPAVLLAENEDATLLHADRSVFRLYPEDPHDTATTTFYATRYGRPLAGAEIQVSVAQKEAPLDVPGKLRTGDDGKAELRMTARDPGNPRRHIDGAVVRCGYALAPRRNDPAGWLSVLVFDKYEIPERPNWVRDVQPIFQRYANLIPVMHDVFDLGNYEHVVRGRTYIRRTLLASTDSPNHMPVTRDLSPGKRDMIVKWLDSAPHPPVLDIDSVEELRKVLQLAVLVEHATVPPYLAALFSIKPGHNTEAAGIIRGVVLEEMQHMAQVCNILNAVGGQPRIGRPGFVPTYPGPLPGPVLPNLRVRLRRYSLKHVQDVFMAIEQPQYPTIDGREFRGPIIDPRTVAVDRRGNIARADEGSVKALEDFFTKAEYAPQTIGWFYCQIARAILRLDRHGKIFTGAPERQVSWPDSSGTIVKVTDRRSALLALHTIIEQGEGSPQDLNGNGVADPAEFGHYYRFEQLVKGRRLIRNRHGRWVYEGERIPFDPEGVHPMADDPDTYKLPADSVARRESKMFDDFYTRLLTTLHSVFNGRPELLDDAVGQMYQGQVQAKKLFDIPVREGADTVVGPAFQSPGIHL